MEGKVLVAITDLDSNGVDAEASRTINEHMVKVARDGEETP